MQQILGPKCLHEVSDTDKKNLVNYHLAHIHSAVAIIIEHLSIMSTLQTVGSLRLSKL